MEEDKSRMNMSLFVSKIRKKPTLFSPNVRETSEISGKVASWVVLFCNKSQKLA
jgi:hypothetical protein